MPTERISILKSKKFLLPSKSKTFNSIMWYTTNGRDYLFKFPQKNNKSFKPFINEVLISAICKRLNLPCQKATFAVFHKTMGVKIESFLSNGEVEIPLYDFIGKRFQQRLYEVVGEDFFEDAIIPMIEKQGTKGKSRIDKQELLNDFFEQVTFLIDCKLKIRECAPAVLKKIEKNYEQIYSLYDEFEHKLDDKSIYNYMNEYAHEQNLQINPQLKVNYCRQIILDLLTGQEDRHLNNISLLQNKKTIRLAPMYDNGHCLLYKRYDESNKTQISLTDFTYSMLTTNSMLMRDLYEIQNFIKNNRNDFINDFIKENFEALSKIIPTKQELNGTQWLYEYLDNIFNYMQTNMLILNKNIEKFKANEASLSQKP